MFRVFIDFERVRMTEKNLRSASAYGATEVLMSKSESTATRDNMNKIMRDLYYKKEAPKAGFVLIIAFYLITVSLTILASRIQGFVWGRPMSVDDALEIVFA